MDQLDQAKSLVLDAETRSPNSYNVHFSRYEIAFLQNDLKEMARQVAWFDAKPEWRTEVLTLQASTSAYFGQIKKARSLLQQAMDIKEAAKDVAGPAGINLFRNYLEAISGNTAHNDAAEVLEFSKNHNL